MGTKQSPATPNGFSRSFPRPVRRHFIPPAAQARASTPSLAPLHVPSPVSNPTQDPIPRTRARSPWSEPPSTLSRWNSRNGAPESTLASPSPACSSQQSRQSYPRKASVLCSKPSTQPRVTWRRSQVFTKPRGPGDHPPPLLRALQPGSVPSPPSTCSPVTCRAPSCVGACLSLNVGF